MIHMFPWACGSGKPMFRSEKCAKVHIRVRTQQVYGMSPV